MSRRYAQQGSGVFLPLAAVVVVVLLLLAYLYSTGALSNLPGLIQNATGTVPTSIATTSAPQSNTTVPPGGSTTISNYAQNSTVDEYALSLINNDRKQYGLPPVALSDEASGQQHSNNMLRYGYLSHWDVYGMKPYMRYTLLGGRGAVSENVAFISNQSCGLFGCHGNINVEQALKNMEYSMMYNDSQCCNNGHRDNILDPSHNLVSIGISYNSSTVYFTEDFIDNYTTWNSGTPSYSNNEVYLQGGLAGGYSISEVLVSYDPVVQSMSVAQLQNTSSYSYGTEVAGVVSDPFQYYSGLQTIVADRYHTGGGSFDIRFNMRNVTSQYGSGEYTVMVWLNSTSGSSFVGSTYTLFLNGDGSQFTTSGV